MGQLLMWWKKQLLPEYILPDGFYLRTYRQGDAPGWIDICSEGLNTRSMTEDDFNRDMLQKDGIFPQGIFFISNKGNEVIGTATGVLKNEPSMGYLHMVSIHPAYRGRGFARAVNAAVLNYLVDRGCENVTLHTDDFRIPAIKVYLSLGFRPVIYEDEMVDRWQKILKVLGIEEIDTFTADGKDALLIKAGE